MGFVLAAVLQGRPGSRRTKAHLKGRIPKVSKDKDLRKFHFRNCLCTVSSPILATTDKVDLGVLLGRGSHNQH